MKVAITGKGGVGKTTLSSTLARLYADEGRTVLAADVDPDANLGLALGLSEEEVNAIVPVSKMKQLAKERTGANDQNSFYKLNPEVSDLPEKLAKEINGVKLLVMGTVDTGGTGCVCPEPQRRRCDHGHGGRTRASRPRHGKHDGSVHRRHRAGREKRTDL